MTDHKPNIAVDFDGVIHDDAHPVEGRRMGPPVEGARGAMESLRGEFHVTVFSVRATPEGRAHIEDWMAYYGIPYDEVTNVKPSAEFYIDDHGLRFRDWDQALSDVGRLQ